MLLLRADAVCLFCFLSYCTTRCEKGGSGTSTTLGHEPWIERALSADLFCLLHTSNKKAGGGGEVLMSHNHAKALNRIVETLKLV